jgi:ABC-type antimicrobial peptide transport system permease subunit
MGARKSHVFLQFVAEAILICFAGGIAGIVMAFLVSWVMGKLPLPQFFAAPAISASLLALVFGFIVGAGIISGIFPAKRASDSDVIASLHYE